MMSGRVNQFREAILNLVIIGKDKSKLAVEAVIDTGFNGDVILPIDIVLSLGLELQGYQESVLGDGTIAKFPVYLGTVIWDGQKQIVEINAATTGSLIGMGLLEGYKLEIDSISNGVVSITSLDLK